MIARYLAACLYDTVIILGLLMGLTAVLLVLRHGEAITAGSVWYQLCLCILMLGYYLCSMLYGGQTIGMKAWRLQLQFQTQNSKLLGIQQRILWFWPALMYGIVSGQSPQLLLRKRGAALLVKTSD